MFDLKNRSAVVTGASAGLGVNFAKVLARQNASVAILARRKEKLEHVAKEIRSLGAKCLAVPCDVTKTEEIKAAVKQVKEEYGKIDILINNAGGIPTRIPALATPKDQKESISKDSEKPARTLLMTDEKWSLAVDLNLTSVFKCCREFGREMLAAGYGRIVNISSVMGIVAQAGNATIAYNATKGGIINLTRGLAASWATKGVTVNALCPGFFPSETNDAPMQANEKFRDFVKASCPMKRMGKEGELDSAILFLVCDESSYVTGSTVVVDGGWTSV